MARKSVPTTKQRGAFETECQERLVANTRHNATASGNRRRTTNMKRIRREFRWELNAEPIGTSDAVFESAA